MKFQKGNRFGKGRPSGTGYVEICQNLAENGGWERLYGWAEGKYGAKKNLRIQFEALKLVLAYGYGRPKDSSKIVEPDEDMWQLMDQFDEQSRKAKEESRGPRQTIDH